MSNIILTVTDLMFPADLQDKYAGFRLQVYLRYADADGNLKEVMEVTPGAGENDYWECEKKTRRGRTLCGILRYPKSTPPRSTLRLARFSLPD